MDLQYQQLFFNKH